jgi:hypothetical protein
MESIRIPFEQDDFGNDIFARVSWTKDVTKSLRPIGIILLDDVRMSSH